MTYWQPIETAPRSGRGHEGRDGPDLLLLRASGGWHRGCWIGKPVLHEQAGWMIDGGLMPKDVIGWHLPPPCDLTIKFSQIPTTHSSNPALWDDDATREDLDRDTPMSYPRNGVGG